MDLETPGHRSHYFLHAAVGVLDNLVAPQAHHRPSVFGERSGDSSVPPKVAFKFLLPEVCVRLRQIAMARAVMPKTRIQKNRYLSRRERDIYFVGSMVE